MTRRSERYAVIRDGLASVHHQANTLCELIEQQRAAPQRWVYGAMERKAKNLRHDLSVLIERWRADPDNDNNDNDNDDKDIP